ncbi:hypothetical protein ACLOJK_016078 [Asimina triloba]
MTSLGSLKSAIYQREERKQLYQAHILGLNAYDRHKKFVKDYGRRRILFDACFSSNSYYKGYLGTMSYSSVKSQCRKSRRITNSPLQGERKGATLNLTSGLDFYGKARNAQNVLPIKTDQDTLREGYRFIRSEEDDVNPSWEQRLVKRYYDKLFKEYCLADMSQYKSGKIGLRWRTEKEVISGKEDTSFRLNAPFLLMNSSRSIPDHPTQSNTTMDIVEVTL